MIKSPRSWLPLFVIVALGTTMLPGGPSLGADGKEAYQKVCSFCHDDGQIGAPRAGDQGEWKRRMSKGIDMLYANTLNGIGHMPPRMDRRGLSDKEIEAAVDYLISISR